MLHGVPGRPVRFLTEFGGGLPQSLPEGACKGIAAVVAAVVSNARDRLLRPICQTIGCTVQPHELKVLVGPDTEELRELSMEMKLRECSDLAQPLERETFIQVCVDEFEHAAESRLKSLCGWVLGCCAQHCFSWRARQYAPAAQCTRQILRSVRRRSQKRQSRARDRPNSDMIGASRITPNEC